MPGCSWTIVDILVRAGLPKGVLNLVMGRGSVVGEAMLDCLMSTPSPLPVRSRQAGRRAQSAQQMRKFQLEMGGKNPLVVLDDADLETAVECAANGGYFQTGQRCTASSRVVVTAASTTDSSRH